MRGTLRTRLCYGTELTPEYCDVIVERYVRHSGNKQIMLNGKTIEWVPSRMENSALVQAGFG